MAQQLASDFETRFGDGTLQPITITVQTARALSGLSEGTIFNAIKDDAFEHSKVGKRRMIAYASFRAWLLGQASA